MTEKRFAEITVKIWRLRQRFDKASADIKKRGTFLAPGKANPSLRPYMGAYCKMQKLAQELVAD
jgi:hypothetical protein